jgi:hypothetical protein
MIIVTKIHLPIIVSYLIRQLAHFSISRWIHCVKINNLVLVDFLNIQMEVTSDKGAVGTGISAFPTFETTEIVGKKQW